MRKKRAVKRDVLPDSIYNSKVVTKLINQIMIDGKKVKTISKLSKEEIDDNSMRLLLDDTVELDDLVKEIKKDE